MILRQTGLHDARDVLQFLMTMLCAFPDLITFAKLTLTIPVSSAKSESSFSTLNDSQNLSQVKCVKAEIE